MFTIRLFFAFVLLALPGMSAASSVLAAYPGWLMDGRVEPVRNGFGECWRVGRFTADTDRSACEGKPADPMPVAPASVETPPVPVVRSPAMVSMADFPERVQFAFDSSALSEEARLILDTVADAMQTDSWQGRLQLVGHACSLGRDAYNQALSERRARAVADYLQARGVGSDRMSIAAKGESQPLEPNDTEQGRRANRRVEMVVIIKP